MHHTSGQPDTHATKQRHCFWTRSIPRSLCCSLIAVLVGSVAIPAQAEDTGNVAAQIAAIQEQLRATQGLQDQLHSLQHQLNALQMKDAAGKAAEPTPAGAAAKASDGGVTDKNVNITFGGFIEAAGIYRNKNQTTDIASSFNSGIPFANSPNAHISEFRGTARQSRLSILAQTSIGDDTLLSAWYEMDFLGGAPTANSNESNSYNPRIRNVYLTVDKNDAGYHLLAGQNWSLMTQNRVGITPRTEMPPIGIDAQFVPGFNWTRNPQLRLVKDFNKTIWVGVSAESPAALIATGPGATQAPPLTIANPGAGVLGTTGNYTTDPAPDLIAKVAADPGWGHYEVFGVNRWFRSRAAFNNLTSHGTGVGGSILLPLIPQTLDFQSSVLIGRGLGRYGSAQLPDVTTGPDGNLVTLPFRSALAGLVGHPTKALDVYAYAGTEQVGKRYAIVGANLYGYGNPLVSNAGCLTESKDACTANTSRIYQLTGGLWYKFFQGRFGMAEYGVQDSWSKRYVFTGIGGAPTAGINVVMVSMRYYPF